MYMQKEKERERESRHRHHKFQKIKSKRIVCLNISIKHLEENIGKNWCGFQFGDEFLDIRPKAKPMKNKTNNLDFIENKLLLWKMLLREWKD